MPQQITTKLPNFYLTPFIITTPWCKSNQTSYSGMKLKWPRWQCCEVSLSREIFYRVTPLSWDPRERVRSAMNGRPTMTEIAVRTYETLLCFVGIF